MKRRDRIAALTEAPSDRAGWWPDCGGGAIGAEAAVARIVLDQQRQSSADRCSESAEHKVSAAPSQTPDQERCQRRHYQRADADTAHGKPGSKAAAPYEPSLHRADGGNVGTADAQS